MTGKMFDSLTKFTLDLDHKESCESFDDQIKDTMQIAYKNEDNQIKKT